jgi:hypothetical protein
VEYAQFEVDGKQRTAGNCLAVSTPRGFNWHTRFGCAMVFATLLASRAPRQFTFIQTSACAECFSACAIRMTDNFTRLDRGCLQAQNRTNPPDCGPSNEHDEGLRPEARHCVHLSSQYEPQIIVQQNASDQAEHDGCPGFDAAPLSQQHRNSD